MKWGGRASAETGDADRPAESVDGAGGAVKLMRAAPRGSSDGSICLLVQDKTAQAAQDGLHPLEAPGSGPDG